MVAAGQATHIVLLIVKYERHFDVGADVWEFLRRTITSAGVDATKHLLFRKLTDRYPSTFPRHLRDSNGVLERVTEDSTPSP